MTCPDCGHIHVSTDARAIGRFGSVGPTKYRADYFGSPVRATRAEAEKDMCQHRRTR